MTKTHSNDRSVIPTLRDSAPLQTSPEAGDKADRKGDPDPVELEHLYNLATRGRHAGEGEHEWDGWGGEEQQDQRDATNLAGLAADSS
jgi:hypothetical protein